MHPTRRSLLLSGAALGMMPRHALAGGVNTDAPEYLVVVFVNGGWDVTFSIDPKPEIDGGPVDGPWVDRTSNPADIEEVRTFSNIPIQVNDFKRPAVTSFFSKWASRCCVVNGVWTGSIVHQPSRIRMLTGTQLPHFPDYATIVGVERGSPELPLGTIDFSGLGYAGDFAATTGRLGYSSQLKALLDPASTFAAPRWADYTLPLFVPGTDEEAAIAAHLRARADSFRGAVTDNGRNDHMIDGLLESYDRRERMIERAPIITGPLELGRPPSLDLQASLAVDLLTNGVCTTVTMGDPGSSWDTHDLNVLQHDRYQGFFRSLELLITGLSDAAILDKTLVVVMSEMTRTPKRNSKGGKDHWAQTSQIWIGGGVRGGTVVGGTSEIVEALPIQLDTGEVDEVNGSLNKYDNVVAGILTHMGVDAEAYLPNVVPFGGATLG